MVPMIDPSLFCVHPDTIGIPGGAEAIFFGSLFSNETVPGFLNDGACASTVVKKYLVPVTAVIMVPPLTLPLIGDVVTTSPSL